MAYFERRTDGKRPTVYCDTCAETRIPFETYPDGTKHQMHPWCWAPIWGGLPSLDEHDCKKFDVCEHDWLGLCDACKKRC